MAAWPAELPPPITATFWSELGRHALLGGASGRYETWKERSYEMAWVLERLGLLQEYGISQLPVSEAPEGDALAGIVGSVSEKSLLDREQAVTDAAEKVGD